LKKRGKAIGKEDYETMRKINKLIDEKCEDPETRDKWQRPCSCFITFNDEEGSSRAENYNEAVHGKIATKK